MKKILSILIMMVLGLNSILAASFTLNAPSQVPVGEKFSVTYSLVDAEGDDLNAPQIEGCKLIFGPSTSYSSSFKSYNGKSESSTRVDYTFIYRAERVGTFTIPAATIIVGPKTLVTKPATITVVDGNSRGRNQSQGGNSPGQRNPVSVDDPDTQTADRSVNPNDLFVRIIFNKTTAYEQEAIECTIKIFTKYSISSFMTTRQPSFDGCLIEEVDVGNLMGKMENYNGQNYMTAVLKKCIIFPQTTGKLTINSGEYDLNVVQYDHVNMGLFTIREPKERKLKVSSNTGTIEVKPLPEPRPAGFSGAVGTFEATTRLVGNTFKTNDPATLVYTITGTGNIKYLHEPAVDFPAEMEQYSPKSDITAKVNGSTVSGKMVIDYTFVPQSVGTFTIPGGNFVYFNPASGRYETVNLPSHTINVAKGSDAKDAGGAVKIRNTDILNIQMGASGRRASEPLFYTLYYWLIFPVIIILVGAIIVIYRLRARRAADIVGTRLARAGKVARRRLKAARGFMERGKADEFYEEMLRAMWGYLSDKLVIPVSKLSRDNISAELTNYGAKPEVIDSIISILDDCEMARYTPDSSARMNEVYDRAAQAIGRLESKN
ncbi:MAG: protein BatD [Muribaculaceae bacterium]|nr:protein BatD [Muribaculaceae bacterium]